MNYALLFLGLLVIHYVADFILQTHWQASNKSKNNEALTRHVLTYSLGFLVGLPALTTWTIGLVPSSLLVLFVIATFATHWVTDYVTSRCSSYFYGKQDWHNFFVVIGLDQLIHQATLFLTMYCLFVPKGL